MASHDWVRYISKYVKERGMIIDGGFQMPSNCLQIKTDSIAIQTSACL